LITVSIKTINRVFIMYNANPKTGYEGTYSGIKMADNSEAITTISILKVALNMARSLPLYSVNVPATISVSAPGVSKGALSSLPWAAIIATTNPGMLSRL
jgi:hypothetical protein